MKMRWGAAAATAWATALAAQGPAPAPDAAALFGQRASVLDISLAPDGKSIAYLAPAPNGRGSVVYVAPVAGGAAPKAILSSGGTAIAIDRCSWVANDRLACDVGGVARGGNQLIPFTRLIAVDADGGNQRDVRIESLASSSATSQYAAAIVPTPGVQDGALLVNVDMAEQFTTGTRSMSSDHGRAVFRIDTRTLKRQQVERPRPDARSFLADAQGRVRVMTTLPTVDSERYDGDRLVYFFRRPDAAEWLRLGDYDRTRDRGLAPIAIGEDGRLIAWDHGEGVTRLVRLALDGSGGRETVDTPAGTSSLLTRGIARRPVGFFSAGERLQATYFDAGETALVRQLEQKLPGRPVVEIVDASRDDAVLLLRASSDVEPGRYYLYDRSRRTLNEIMLERPALEKVALAENRWVEIPRDGGGTMRILLTLPPGRTTGPLPTVLQMPGEAGSRLSWGYGSNIQFLAHQGYAVVEIEGRRDGPDAAQPFAPYADWRPRVADIAAVVRKLVADGIVDPKRIAALGTGYGGFLALETAVAEPGLLRAVIANAPVTDLAVLREDYRDYTSSQQVGRQLAALPAGTAAAMPTARAAAIKVPVLLFHGDAIVSPSSNHSVALDAALRRAGGSSELVVLRGLDEDVDDSAARIDMYRRMDVFLRRSFGL